MRRSLDGIWPNLMSLFTTRTREPLRFVSSPMLNSPGPTFFPISSFPCLSAHRPTEEDSLLPRPSIHHRFTAVAAVIIILIECEIDFAYSFLPSFVPSLGGGGEFIPLSAEYSAVSARVRRSVDAGVALRCAAFFRDAKTHFAS